MCELFVIESCHLEVLCVAVLRHPCKVCGAPDDMTLARKVSDDLLREAITLLWMCASSEFIK